MKKQYDSHRRPSTEYKKGDKVYINAEHLPRTRPSKKLDKKFFGPYEIIEKVGASAYRIKIPMTWRIYNVFNEVLLKPYYPPIFPGQKNHNGTEPEEEITDVDDGNYEVEELLDSRIMLGLRPQHNQSLNEEKGLETRSETRSLLRCNKQSQD